MTCQSYNGSVFHAFAGAYTALAAMLLLALSGPAIAQPAAWQDPMTGLAIGGYDPLAYYTRGEARTGNGDFELSWGGAVWRFDNSGNMEAFRRHPQVYAPRFAGYDPYVIASGKTTRGQPSIWVRDGDSILLFHSAANRHLWLQDRDALLELAELKWPELADTLPDSIGQ